METPEHAVVRTSPRAPGPEVRRKTYTGWLIPEMGEDARRFRTERASSPRRKNLISTQTVLILDYINRWSWHTPTCSEFREIASLVMFSFLPLRRPLSKLVIDTTVALLNTFLLRAARSFNPRAEQSEFLSDRADSAKITGDLMDRVRLSGDSSFMHDHGSAIHQTDKSIFLAITIRVNRSLKIQRNRSPGVTVARKFREY